MLNLSSNDYLGLSSRQDLRDEFIEQLQESGLPFSSSSSRLLTGNFMVYTELEELMANRFGREAALLFNSGYHANTGILPALTDKQSLILADKLVHASIIDGILLSGAPYQRYRHNDYEHLEQLLAKYVHAYEQIIIVTESIFSMDGDIADLGRLVSLKKKISEYMALCRRGACYRCKRGKRLGGRRRAGLHPRYRSLGRYLRKGFGINGSLSVVQPDG